MDAFTDREIYNASEVIDKALLSIDKANRGEVACRILSVVRNLNDHIADKVWSDMHPEQPMGLQKVASKFIVIRNYQFIAKFDKFLRKSVSHFTPTEEGAERLLIKYYKYILQLKKIVYDRYKMDIIMNIDYFLEDIDEQTKEYYKKISNQIEGCYSRPKSKHMDNYYIDKAKPFYVNHNIYYEITLELADERPNKFNRVTAFTKDDIFTNHCVALSFSETSVNVFDVDFPIKVITEWYVSIRPCEINNLAKTLLLNTNIQRGNKEYKKVMDYLKYNQISLIDIIYFEECEYNKIKELVSDVTRTKQSMIFEILDKCRNIIIYNQEGKNIILYLLNRIRNQIIKDQWTDDPDKTYGDLFLSYKCLPFDKNPFSFNPKRHTTNTYDLLECIDASERSNELLARLIDNNTRQHSLLFTPMNELINFGTSEKIVEMIDEYNDKLFYKFRPESELGVYKECVYNKGHEKTIVEILNRLRLLSSQSSEYSAFFNDEKINELETLEGSNRLDDPDKVAILNNMFTKSKVHFVYGAAGTGKTTLVNHICHLMLSSNKVLLAKTNPAVENLKRKVTCCNSSDDFLTIDRFTKNSRYRFKQYDLIIIDECSTVKNEEILKVIQMVNDGILVLVGDTYQIESIGFGNWFSICRNEIPSYCCHELTTPHRSSDEHLKKLWYEVRNMSEDNLVLENMVKGEYSHSIDNDIFIKKSDDEIILCLNYNGLYGLNNINRLLQLNNPNEAVDIGIWQFKVGDPILFNDSGRFDVLYNNLKGRIIKLENRAEFVYFTVEIDLLVSKSEVEFDGLDYIKSDAFKTTVCFSVNRRAPYSSDNESVDKGHILPFQVAYAVSIHKSQGLEYDSVKLVIADETEDRISHNIFYTAITRSKSKLRIYWSPEVCNRVLSRIRPANFSKDYYLLKEKNHF